MQALPAFVMGLAVAFGFGVFHHLALTGILKIAPHHRSQTKSVVVVTFGCLLALHTAEILSLALFNDWAITYWDLDALGSPAPTFTDLLYLTGIAFSTLGYTSLDATGAFRLLLMFQSLLGFMLLTWSATFLFSACQKSWQQNE